MNRAILWSTLALSVATGSGCGAAPPSVTTGSQAAFMSGGKAAPKAEVRPAALAPAPSNRGLNFIQDNYLGDTQAFTGSSVSVQQTNQVTTLLLDDPKDILKYYAELPVQVLWDITTRDFYVTQANLVDGVVSYSEAGLVQLNKVLIIVDPNAAYYNGTIVQLNAADSATAHEGSQLAIDQLNDITVIQRDEDAPDSDDFVAALRGSENVPLSSAAVLAQKNHLLIYIDVAGRPHFYQWKPPTGKNGLSDYRRRG